jgi:uncharacterized protein
MTPKSGNTRCTAFKGSQRIATGELAEVVRRTKEALDQGGHESVLIFEDTSGEQVEVDFRGTADDVVKRLAEGPWGEKQVASVDGPDHDVPRRPGRPKLGVIAREVTLLPRHWDWLNSQPGGASVALRKLVEEARRVNADRDRVRRTQEAAYGFMSATAGNLPNFEEAIRSLFANNLELLHELIKVWPEDIQSYLTRLIRAGVDPSAQLEK